MAEELDASASRRARLASLLPAGSLGRSVSVLAGGAAVAQGLTLVSSVLINRLYSPASFGQYGAASSLVALVTTIGSLKYDLAIPLPGDEKVAANLVALSVFVLAGLAATSALLLIVAGGSILHLFNAQALMPYAWLLLVAQLGGCVYNVFLSFAIRQKQFQTIARTRITQAVANVGTQIAIGLVSASPAGLMAGETMGLTAGSGRLGRDAWRVSSVAIKQVSFAGIRAVAHRYRKFAILSSPAALLNAIGYYSPLLLVVALYGARTGGLFALGQRLIQAPVVLLTMSISQVFVAEAAVLAREDPPALRALFSRTIRRLAMLGTPVVLVLAVAAPLLTGPVFGSRWEQAGIYVTILAPFFLCQLAASPLGGTLDVLERQDLHLIREIARVTITSGAVVAASALNLSAEQAIAVLSAAGSVAYILYGLISWYAIVQAGDRDDRLVN
ncbi:MAG: oligosaccharide flippase family protein [Solirubrobacteraceae bacterium]